MSVTEWRSGKHVDLIVDEDTKITSAIQLFVIDHFCHSLKLHARYQVITSEH